MLTKASWTKRNGCTDRRWLGTRRRWESGTRRRSILHSLYAILVSCAWKAKFQSTGIKYSLSQKVNQLLQLAYTWGNRVSTIHGALGRALLWALEEGNARVAFQQEIELQGGVFVYTGIRCDGCHLLFSCVMKRLVCKHCLDVDVCGQCFRSHEAGDKVVSSCVNHCFLEVAPDELSGSSEAAHFDEAKRAS